MKCIVGKFNNKQSFVNYWKVGKIRNEDIGNYAVVENLNGYDLVKIIGISEVDESQVKYVTGNHDLKKVKTIISKDIVEEMECIDD